MTIENALIKTLGFGSKTFIEKAIEGGWAKKYTPDGASDTGVWVYDGWRGVGKGTNGGIQTRLPVQCVLLDPLAWQAVGKVEGWSANPDKAGDEFTSQYSNCVPYEWPWQMHRFIDFLAEGN